MNSLTKILLPIVLLSLCISCNSLFNKGDSEIELKIESQIAQQEKTTFNGDTLVFEPVLPGNIPSELPSFISKIKNKQIIIKGYLMVPMGGPPVEGKIIKQDDHITITITYKPGHLTISKGVFYTAYVNGLSKGTYNVKIVHEMDLLRGDGENYTAFTEKMTIGENSK